MRGISHPGLYLLPSLISVCVYVPIRAGLAWQWGCCSGTGKAVGRDWTGCYFPFMGSEYVNSWPFYPCRLWQSIPALFPSYYSNSIIQQDEAPSVFPATLRAFGNKDKAFPCLRDYEFSVLKEHAVYLQSNALLVP